MGIKRFLYSLLVAFIILSFLSSQSYALISLEDEEIIGKRLLVEMRKQVEFIQDDFANQYIDRLGHYLIRPLQTKAFPFHFYLIKKNIINAFAAPGGHIYIFSGLINLTDNVDELAAVVCHEIGHVSARHLAQRLEKSSKLGYLTLAAMLMGAILGGGAAGGLAAGSMAASAQLELHYSRNDERQADELGFRYISASGFDPSAMLSVLKKITDQSLYALDDVPPYLLTHPVGSERLSNIQAMLSTYRPIPPTKEVRWFRREFPLFKTIVYAESVDPDDAVKYYKDILKQDPGSPLANFGLGIAYMRISEYQKAVLCMEKTLNKWPDCMPVLINLGITYQRSGKDDKAIEVLKRALRIDDINRSALFFLGVSYENMKDYKKAIEIFRRLIYLRSDRDDLYYHLGISYAKIGKLGLAHYNFGIYFSKLYQINKARFHFLKARKFAKGNKRLLDDISARLREMAGNFPKRKRAQDKGD